MRTKILDERRKEAERDVEEFFKNGGKS